MTAAILDHDPDPAIPSSESEASDRMQVVATAELGDRPIPSRELTAWTKALWQEVEDNPDHAAVVEAAKFARKTLFPAWWDPKDPWGGRIPAQMRNGRYDRQVRTMLAYLNLRQNVAQTVPSDHKPRWSAAESLDDQDPTGEPQEPDPVLRRFGDTVGVVTRRYLERCNIQEVMEGWVADAHAFPLGIVKAWFQRSWDKDPIGESASGDERDNMSRARVIAEDIERGEVRQGDPAWIELERILFAMQGSAELKLRREIVVQRLDLNQFKISPEVKSFDRVYRAAWMAHIELATVDELRARYPFQRAEGADTWTGIHPEDLDALAGVGEDDQGGGRRRGSKKRASATGSENGTGRGQAGSKHLRLIEVWDRRDNTVTVLVEGLDYPVHQWVPQRTPSQWFPFYLINLNAVPGSPYGISDVELVADIQARRNRKRSDEEKARWNSLSRYIFDANTTDGKVVQNIGDIEPGELVGLPLGGKGLEVKDLAQPYRPEAFATYQDDQDARAANSLSEQSLGVTGNAKFATEVETANAGTAIASSYRKQRVTQALERFYHGMAQILIQELSEDEAAQEAGPGALWPKVYEDAEAQRLLVEIQGRHRQDVAMRIMPQLQAQLVSVDPAERTQEIIAIVEREARPAIERECLARFGYPEPLTREALYNRLRVQVVVGYQDAMDRRQRLGEVTNLLTAIGQAAQGAQAAGLSLRPWPLLRLLGRQDDLAGAFVSDPNQLGVQLMQAIKSNPGAIDPNMLAALALTLPPEVRAQAAQAAMAEGQKRMAAESDQPAPG
jgi:hypothetical protein